MVKLACYRCPAMNGLSPYSANVWYGQIDLAFVGVPFDNLKTVPNLEAPVWSSTNGMIKPTLILAFVGVPLCNLKTVSPPGSTHLVSDQRD